MLASLLAASLALVVSGCASAPERNGAMDSADSAVREAHDDAFVTGAARVELENADAALSRGQHALSAGRPAAEVEHEAYLADRNAHASQVHGRLIASDAAIAAAGGRRYAVLLDARQDEIQRSNADSALMAAQVAGERSDAPTATPHADTLDGQLRELQPSPTDGGVVVTLGDPLFQADRSELSQDSEPTIATLSSFLIAHPRRSLRIEGFTDDSRDAEESDSLSGRRATSVSEALTRHGVSAARISSQGYGSRYPVADNGSVAGRQSNQRVEVVISDSEAWTAERTR
jgi:outer membrane protein OmpA-like peptidoglycan-associated protein